MEQKLDNMRYSPDNNQRDNLLQVFLKDAKVNAEKVT